MSGVQAAKAGGFLRLSAPWRPAAVGRYRRRLGSDYLRRRFLSRPREGGCDLGQAEVDTETIDLQVETNQSKVRVALAART
jgi:hypothetical protein